MNPKELRCCREPEEEDKVAHEFKCSRRAESMQRFATADDRVSVIFFA